MKTTHPLGAFLLLISTLLLPLGTTNAHTTGATTWTGANSSDWADDENWTTATAPVTGEAPTARGIRINIGATSPNHPTPPELIYSSAQGDTIYNIASNRALVIGNGSGTNGTVTFTGGTFDSQGTQNDAMSNGGGTATLNISGGHYTNVNGGSTTFTLGLNFGGTATLNVNNGSFTTGTLSVGEGTASGGAVNGIVNLNSVVIDEVTHEGILAVGNFSRRASPAVSTINFNGGILRASDDNPDYMREADVNTARVEEMGAKIDTNGFDITIGRALIEGTTEGGGLTKKGEGTLTLGGENTYTGATEIEAGTLVLTGATQATVSISFASESDGVLGLDIASPVTASSAAVNLTNGTIRVLGTPAANSYTLLTAASIADDPVLAENIEGYSLQVVGNTELRLVSDNPTADPYLAWAGEGVLFADDSNGDGVSNGLAFLLGAADPDVSALVLLPTASEDAGKLTLAFSMLNSTARGDAALAIEHSNSLETGSWTTVPVPDADGETVNGNVTFNITLGSPLNTVTATISSAAANGTGKLFGRLKAEN